jgi:hypothetical protein
MVIKVSKKEVDNWKAHDFVKFFVTKFNNHYEGVTYPTDFAKEGMIFKRIMQKFRKYGKSKESLTRFIDWVFAEYSKRAATFTDPLTIGFLPSWVDDYLNITPDLSKPKRKEPELTDEMKKWLEEEGKRYKQVYVKRGR